MENKFDITTFEPKSTEAIVIQFNFNEIKVRELKWIFDDIVEKFPNNIVVAAPNSVSLQSWSKENLENYIKMLTETIEKM